MYKIIFILITTIFLNANDKYEIVYKDIALGNIKNFKTIKDGYLVAQPKNSWMKTILGFDNYIIFQENKQPNISGDNIYKKDNYLLLTIIDELSVSRRKSQIINKNNQMLEITCENNICEYTRTNMQSNESFKGSISFTKNNKLNKICDYESNFCINKQ